jgi:Ca-activated chloride channel family protein
MRIKLFFLFLIFNSISFSQLVFEKTKHDFGDLEPYSDRFVDIKVTNNGAKKEYLLSVKKPYDVVYLVNGDFIEKDSSLIVRLQVNPKVKGRFGYEVQIYTSDKDEPTIVKITGNLKNPPTNNLSAFTACPDFSSRPAGRTSYFNLTVVTIDKNSKQPLAKSNVSMIQNGQPIWTLNSDKNGAIKKESTLGLSYFYATHPGYLPAELGAYVNFQRNYIVLELEIDSTKPLPIELIEEPIVALESTKEVTTTVQLEDLLEEELSNEIPTSQNIEVPLELSALDKSNFSDQYFKPVNIVFVLDVSASMNQGDKMELMKYSLFQLASMLRAQDKMAIVTYSTNAQVLLVPTTGADKEKINGEVAALKAGGMTAGGAGIKLGYKEALKGKLQDGVNQIIVITDGAFNRNSDDYKKYIKKYSKKGIQMSVVGIKNKDVDEKQMREAAEMGLGRYIPIFKLVDAQNNLKEEIRLNAFKKN